MDDECGEAPVRAEGFDVGALPISDRDRDVLALVDGERTAEDIARAAGLERAAVRESLEMLEWLGAIQEPSNRAPEPSGGEEPSSSARVDEDVDIDEAVRRRIDDMLAKLESCDHYEALNVSSTATKKEIKEAYYALIPVFHPDRYFGRRLGSFRGKIELVFRRLTEAHEVLTRRATRREYDAYLGLTRETTAFESIPPPPDSALRAYLADDADVPGPKDRGDQRPGPDVAAPRGAPIERPSDPRARRRALARRLRGAARTVAQDDGSPATAEKKEERKAAARERAARDLKRLYSEKTGTGDPEQQIAVCLRRADELMETDPVGAARALQVAAALAPEDEEIRARLERADESAAARLADTYLKRASYEEGRGDWGNAAASYARAAAGLPDDPDVLERAANATLKASGDLRKAVAFAKRAVIADPSNVRCRSTAARAYQAAGMYKSAAGELQRAIELAPKDATLRDWLRRLRTDARE